MDENKIDVKLLSEMVMSRDLTDVKIAFDILKENRNNIPIEDLCEILQCVFVEREDRSLNDYYICKYNCTQGMFEAVTRYNPSSKTNSRRNPVDHVGWIDSHKFIEWCNRNIMPDGYEMDLPSLSELSYATRGGKYSKGYKYAGSNNLDEVAWTDDDENQHESGLKKPNELGIYDLNGKYVNPTNELF